WGSCSQSSVLPSTSVSRNVTVPVGNSIITARGSRGGIHYPFGVLPTRFLLRLPADRAAASLEAGGEVRQCRPELFEDMVAEGGIRGGEVIVGWGAVPGGEMGLRAEEPLADALAGGLRRVRAPREPVERRAGAARPQQQGHEGQSPVPGLAPVMPAGQ